MTHRDDEWLLRAELEEERDRRMYADEQYQREREMLHAHARQAAGEYADRMDELQGEVDDLASDLAAAESRWEALRGWVEQLGMIALHADADRLRRDVLAKMAELEGE
jgi:hypothetical protein